MSRKIRSYLPRSRTSLVCAAVLCVAAATDIGAQDKAPAGPPPLFSAPLADVPGKQLVVVALTLRPKPAGQPPSPGHRHPGSVYVYVTAGTARLGIEGQPVQVVKAGEGFFEPVGAVHTVSESASATDPASAIAVMIVPEGSPLVLPRQ